MQNPIDYTISAERFIEEAVKTHAPALITDPVWNAFYEQVYQPLTELYDNDVVLKQFVRDKYLVKKALWESELVVFKKLIQDFDTSIDVTAILSQKKPVFNNHRLPTAKSALEEAVFFQDLQRCCVLLTEKPREVFIPDSKGFKPFHNAICSNNFDLKKLFCHFIKLTGMSINISTDGELESTPLHLAVQSNEINTICLLLAHGANPNRTNTKGQTALHWAVSSLKMVKLLLAQGAKLNLQDDDGYTPLHRAVKLGEPEIAQYLFELGADPTLKTKDNKTIFDLIPTNNAALFQFLYDKNEIDRTNRDALFCFEYLAANRIYPQESPETMDAIYHALQIFGQPDVALLHPEKALSAIPKISIAGSFFHGNTPVAVQPEHQNALVEACRNADLASVKKYVEIHKANPLIPDKNGQYALSEAIWSLSLNIVSWLLKEQNPAYTKEDLEKILSTIQPTHKSSAIFPVSPDMKTFHDWGMHCKKKNAPWFYNYEEVKKRETENCLVNWKTDKHPSYVGLPSFAKENHPFIKLEFTGGGRYVLHTREAYRDNLLSDHPKDSQPVQWLYSVCNQMKAILYQHGIILKNDYSLYGIELPEPLKLSVAM